MYHAPPNGGLFNKRPYIFDMLKNLIQNSIVCLAILGCIACAHFEPEKDPQTHVELPPTFSLYGDTAPAPIKWWQTFENTELSDLIETALENSFTLQQAWARLGQAQALRVQQQADRFPDLTGGVEAGLGRRRVENDNTQGTGQTNKIENYGISLISNYEIDLWGRIRAVGEAAIRNEEARQSDLAAAAMTLSAEIAQRWVNVIALRRQFALLQNQLKTNQIRQELVELRYLNGLASSVDVFQQRELVARVEGRIPLVETQTALILNQMSLLLGKPHQGPPIIDMMTLPTLKQIPALGLPMELLANRPDVQASGARLQAARWQWAAARAARLPAIRLTGTARYGADAIDMVFSNWLINLAANLTAPIFDAGRRKAEADRTQAIIDERLAQYRQTVYTAFLEVENALIQERNLHRNIDAVENEIDNAKKALSEATNRYRKGLGDYLPVLTQLVNVQNLELSLIQRREEIVLARISLHRALGGSWFDTKLSPTPVMAPMNQKSKLDLNNG